MPIYEYLCTACRKRFEELVAVAGETKVVCPECGAPEPERVMSGFATEWKPGNVNWHRLPSRTGW